MNKLSKAFNLALTASAIVMLHATALAQSGPSFDCARAQMADEIAVCSNAELSAMDRVVARYYRRALESVGETARAMARDLLGSRAACGSNIACLRQWHLNAMNRYSTMASGSSQAPQPQQRAKSAIDDYLCGAWDDC